MKFRRIPILTVLSALLAGGLGGVARWNKPNPTSDDLLLQRHIASVHLHNATPDVAIARLQRLIGVPIVVKWDLDRDQRFWLDFDDISVHDLLQAFIEELRGVAGVDFDAKNNSIWIGPYSTLGCSMRVYNISDLRKDAPAQTQLGVDGDEITQRIRSIAEERYWPRREVSDYSQNPPQEWLYQDSTRLYVLQTSAVQMEIAGLLNGVRQARRDGSGPCISRSRVHGEDSTTRIIRFYDVRDMTGRVGYLPAVDWRGGYTRIVAGNDSQIDLLAFAMSIQCSPESWMSAAQIWSMCGRLVIEQTPEVHARIRAMLADLRDGKSAGGFYVTPARAADRAP